MPYRHVLKDEHRTSNIEHRILMTLRFIYFKQANDGISKDSPA